MTNLTETINLMTSSDYKDRFKAEYYQLKIRKDKLEEMTKKWDKGELNFTPTCSREIYQEQLSAMSKYMSILEHRAELEGVEL